MFAFLRGAVVPSTEIIFEWAHDPVGDDTRCLLTLCFLQVVISKLLRSIVYITHCFFFFTGHPIRLFARRRRPFDRKHLRMGARPCRR